MALILNIVGDILRYVLLKGYKIDHLNDLERFWSVLLRPNQLLQIIIVNFIDTGTTNRTYN